MPTPFPGMDPYIESWIWTSFHGNMIIAIHDQLNPRLPKRYVASTDLYVWRVDSTGEEHLLIGEPDKQRYVKIVDKMERRVVTAIEILSPANKSGGEDGHAYRMKREEYIAAGINLVEIDLRRSGQRPPLGNPAPPISDYYILVHRGIESARFGIWPVSVRDPLPLVPIPLDPDVPHVVLDLRACMDHVYDVSRYSEQLDYSRPPVPPLREPDATWARELLASRNGPSA